MQVADHWSKVKDNSEWILHDTVYQQLMRDPVLTGRIPALDAFASTTTSQVPEAFYSKYLCPGSKGVDAMVHPWNIQSTSLGKLLIYINGPFHPMGAIVRKIRDDKVDCILIGPRWPRHWVATLHSMPVRKAVVLPHRHDLFCTRTACQEEVC